jgi:4-hydroxy-tetrahydrodipicolinate synthase
MIDRTPREMDLSDMASGAWAASLTPLNQDLSIDQGALVAHLRWLLDRGCTGVAVLGTTGEANSFSLDERLSLIGGLGASGFAPERILVGVGCCAAPDTIALTRAALDAGFANVMMLPPFYYKNVSDEGLFRAYAGAIEAVNDARLRVIIYDIPPMTGFPLSLALLARLRDAFPGTVVGVKNSSGDWSAMDATLRALPGFKMFAGAETFLLQGLRAGGPGCISAVANINSWRLGKMLETRGAAEAEALQSAASRDRAALQGFPTIAALKEIMAILSGREDWRRVRPPLTPLSPADASALAALASGMELNSL